MCGIAGITLQPGGAPVDPLLASRLTQALAHRGPDGDGHFSINRSVLVQTRLAIIDLQTGDQPLFAGPCTLIANGEVYNYRELAPGLSLSTASDCELPLHLWRQLGPAYAERLRGMYAIAIHDRAARKLTLTRDPFGIKPLYIAPVADGLAFASEPQALLAAGLVQRAVRPGGGGGGGGRGVGPRPPPGRAGGVVLGDVRPAARDELLQMQFTTGADTIFEGIQRVLPGETLVAVDGHLVERQRQEALAAGPPEEIDEAAALVRLDAALMASVDLHQRSDVPYGMFLSSGVDSSAVLTLMARLNSEPVLAYTAGFDTPDVADERLAAAEVAQACGARHETVAVTEAMVWSELPRIVAAMDDPAADYAIIPTWFLARRARQDVKVVLSGEGGDEMFGGYGRYRSAMRPWWRGGRSMRARGTFDRLDVLREIAPGWRDGIAAAEARATIDGRSRLQIAQATDVADWLPHDLLLKLDRCLMAHGVEGRTPFLDPGVAAAAFRLPDELKVRDGRGKWLLRRWLAQAQPKANPFAPKRGFTVPVSHWIARRGAQLGPLVAAQPGVAEIAAPDRVVALFRDAEGRRQGFAAWTLLFYALWHRAHIEGADVSGDTFDVLAAR